MAAAARAAPCDGRGTSIVVDGKARRLWLCAGGASDGDFAVSLGRGGLGKAREGDGRTPRGRYPLGAPRASKEYGTFIPVGYPTAAERARGLTGGAIGIHGPRRGFAFLGRANAWADWTRGCIALATDGEIEKVARWVKSHASAAVAIE